VGDDGTGAPWSLEGRRRRATVPSRYCSRATVPARYCSREQEAAAGGLGLALEAGNL
jgi:hypothetical protein